VARVLAAEAALDVVHRIVDPVVEAALDVAERRVGP